MGEFSGKVVVVTGGSRGIGRAIAQSFAREGAQTVLAASSQANLDAAAAAIGNSGPKPLTLAGDLKTLQACEALHAFVAEKLGRCDVLVNNAGATRSGNFLELPDAAFHDGFALKYFACVRMSRLFWPMLRDAKGHVVNIIGGAARTPDANFLIGGSVNAAVANFSKGLSQLGKREGVNVNVIHPGMTETDRVTQLFVGQPNRLPRFFPRTLARVGNRRKVFSIAQLRTIAPQSSRTGACPGSKVKSKLPNTMPASNWV